MANARYDVLGIGNAIVDVIARADEAFLLQQQMNKGSMTLIDEARAAALYGLMGATTIASGGSAANTIVGCAALGTRTAFIGKVKDDASGKAFAHDIKAMGVHFPTAAATEGPSTAQCLILVSSDGERTMNTYLGACQRLTAADVDTASVEAAEVTYLEGYLWDPPEAKAAFVKAAGLAHGAGRRVALSLSDPFCVDRYRDEFLDLLRKRTVDIVFANEHELKSLYQSADFDTAIAALRDDTTLGVVTRSAQGSVVVTREETRVVAAHPIARLVDTTGAGDLFAAGFLAGLTRDKDIGDCARLGALAAAEVIQHYGARPEADLAQMARDAGLL